MKNKLMQEEEEKRRPEVLQSEVVSFLRRQDGAPSVVRLSEEVSSRPREELLPQAQAA